MEPLDLNDPVAVLLVVTRALTGSGIACATYGGLALAAFGEPRETRDADLAVAGVSASSALDALKTAGLDVTLAFERVAFGGNWVTRFSLLGPAASPAVNTADLVEPRSARYASAALGRAMSGDLRGEAIRILTPEDFIIYKVLSTRARDLDDARAVRNALGDRLDLAAVHREIAALAREIPEHDVLGRASALAS